MLCLDSTKVRPEINMLVLKKKLWWVFWASILVFIVAETNDFQSENCSDNVLQKDTTGRHPFICIHPDSMREAACCHNTASTALFWLWPQLVPLDIPGHKIYVGCRLVKVRCNTVFYYLRATILRRDICGLRAQNNKRTVTANSCTSRMCITSQLFRSVA